MFYWTFYCHHVRLTVLTVTTKSCILCVCMCVYSAISIMALWYKFVDNIQSQQGMSYFFFLKMLFVNSFCYCLLQGTRFCLIFRSSSALRLEPLCPQHGLRIRLGLRTVVFTSCWRCEVNMLSKKELEELRPWVSESVTAFLGFSEDTVVNAALDCVAKSLSRQATTGKRILFYLAHTTAASINASPSWGEPEQEAHCAGLCHDTQTMYSSRVCDCCQLTKLHTKSMQWISGT